jgi:hypothetical protein
MKFILLIHGDEKAQAKRTEAEMQRIVGGHMKFADDLRAAGKMIGGERLRPETEAVRLRLKSGRRQVIDGPFAETKELIAGFWLWNVSSLQEAIDWVKRCPNPMPGDSEIEIRPVFEAADFGEAFTPELRAQEERIRAQAEKRK